MKNIRSVENRTSLFWDAQTPFHPRVFSGKRVKTRTLVRNLPVNEAGSFAYLHEILGVSGSIFLPLRIIACHFLTHGHV